MADLMPSDYVPTRRHHTGGVGGGGELQAAAELARRNPGQWVWVHEWRQLTKPPTSWVSEVNLGQKISLRGAGERWEATYEETLHEGSYLYMKLIRLVPPEQVV